MSHQPIAEGPTVRRHVERSPADVWEQLTSREGFEHWMGPGSTIDPRPGGELIAADPESGEPKVGQVIDVEHECRLRWAWRPLGDSPDEDGTTEVIVEIEPSGAPIPGHRMPGTVITVTEAPSTFTVNPVGAWASAPVGCSC